MTWASSGPSATGWYAAALGQSSRANASHFAKTLGMGMVGTFWHVLHLKGADVSCHRRRGLSRPSELSDAISASRSIADPVLDQVLALSNSILQTGVFGVAGVARGQCVDSHLPR